RLTRGVGALESHTRLVSQKRAELLLLRRRRGLLESDYLLHPHREHFGPFGRRPVNHFLIQPVEDTPDGPLVQQTDLVPRKYLRPMLGPFLFNPLQHRRRRCDEAVGKFRRGIGRRLPRFGPLNGRHDVGPPSSKRYSTLCRVTTYAKDPPPRWRNRRSVHRWSRLPLSLRDGPPSLPRPRHVLIDESRVPVGVEQHEACGPRCGLVGTRRQRDASTLERLLNVAHVVEVGQRASGPVPARVERQHVLVEHSLEEPDGGGLVLQDQPVLRRITADRLETEFFVERPRRTKVLDAQTHGEVSKPHLWTSFG